MLKPELVARAADAPLKESLLRAFNGARHDKHRYLFLDIQTGSIKTGNDLEAVPMKPRNLPGDA